MAPVPTAALQTVAPAGLLERLRSETRIAHEALESRLDILSPDLTLARYLRMLERFHGFWRRWQPAMTGMTAIAPLMTGRTRLDSLEADLAALGRTPSQISALPMIPSLPAIDGAGGALGSLYVMEGSTLGGQLVARHLDRLLGLAPDSGARYFAGYGAETGARWREFRAIFLAVAGTEDDEAVIAGAESTFRVLADWIPA